MAAMRTAYLAVPVGIIIAAGAGRFFAAGGMRWYAGLRLPPWTPSGGVIGAVWTVIFACLALSVLLFVRRAPLPRDWRYFRALDLFAANLTLNALWSFLFFTMHRIDLALAEALLLALSVYLLIRTEKTVSRFAAVLLYPYLLWTLFAAFLAYQILVLNPA